MNDKQSYKLNTTDLGRFLKQIREGKNFTLRKLAKELGISPATISRIENGSPNDHEMSTVERIVNWLQRNLADADDEVILQRLINLGSSLYALPYYESVHAGSPDWADSQPADHWNLNDRLISSKGKTFLVKVYGDSMIDEMIFQGDVLVVEQVAPTDFCDGEIVVAEVNREVTVKKYCKTKQKVALCTANSIKKQSSKEYDDIEITPEREIKLLGRVTHSIRDLKSIRK